MTRLRKICILTTDSSWGGTERMVDSLIRGLSDSSYQISLVTMTGDGSLTQKVKPFCEEVLNLNMRSIWDLKSIFNLIRFIKKGQFHILHTFLYHANILGRLLGRALGVPVIISSQRSTDAWRRSYHVKIDRWTSGFCNLIISNSYAGKTRLETVEKISPEKVAVVHNGIDLSEVPEKRDVKLEKEKRGFENCFVIGMVANFRGMKGHAYFIEAAALLLKERTDLHFLLVGEGKEKTKYELEVQDKGLANHFRFLGRVENIYEALNLLDIFVLTSEWEGFPVSILEAMAFDVPVIATEVGGVPEMIQNGKTGLLIPPRDALSLKEAILKLLGDSDLRKGLVERAHEVVRQHFTQEQMVQGTNVLYEKLLLENGIS